MDLKQKIRREVEFMPPERKTKIDLKDLKRIVKSILEDSIAARNNDCYLNSHVVLVLGERLGIDADEIPVSTFLANMDVIGFPSFESIRQVRKVIQRDCPHLRASPKVEAIREANEQVYKAFARERI